MAGCAAVFLTPSERIFEGRANATDGDSIRLENTRIRLKGIDAPELDQICRRGAQAYRCGEHARDALLSLVIGRPITCKAAGRDKYRRTLAVCTVGGVDIGSRMVASGWAVSYGDYMSEQRQAERRREGLWAGTFELPREWRRAHPIGP